MRHAWFDELEIGEPFPSQPGGAWVAPVTRGDGTPAVLKIQHEHMEARDEADGLRFWDGDPTVRLLEHDPERGALLLEQCRPGTSLAELPEPEQDVVVAGLLKRMWRRPPSGRFRTLVEMIDYWTRELTDIDAAGRLRDLARSSDDDVLLATDLHAQNVLRAEREPWLVIDPKPFVGDRAYDATQHLLNRKDLDDASIVRFAGLLEVDEERVRAWTLARIAACV